MRRARWSCRAGTSCRSSSRTARTARRKRRTTRTGPELHARSEPEVAAAGARAAGSSGSRALTATSADSRTMDSTGSPHQNPSPTNIATNSGASAVPRPSNAFRTSTEWSTASGWNTAVKVFSVGTVRPKPAPRNAVATSSSEYATPCSLTNERARDEQRHRHQARGQAHDRYDPLGTEPTGEAGAEQGAGDRGDHLGQEHRAVLAARQVVLVGVGEDGARRRKRDQNDALHHPGHVDDV